MGSEEKENKFSRVKLMVAISSSVKSIFKSSTAAMRKAMKSATSIDMTVINKQLANLESKINDMVASFKSANRKEVGEGAAAPLEGLTKKNLPELKEKVEGLKNENMERASDVRSVAGNLVQNVGKGNLLVAAGLGSALLYFYIRKKVSEESPRTITKVEMFGTDYKITFSPAINILTTDSVTISGSPVVPDINGLRPVIDAPDDSSIVIRGSTALTTLCPTSGSCGTITVKTSVYGQLADAVENFIPDILPDENVLMKYWWVFLIIALILSSSSAAAVMMSGK